MEQSSVLLRPWSRSRPLADASGTVTVLWRRGRRPSLARSPACARRALPVPSLQAGHGPGCSPSPGGEGGGVLKNALPPRPCSPLGTPFPLSLSHFSVPAQLPLLRGLLPRRPLETSLARSPLCRPNSPCVSSASTLTAAHSLTPAFPWQGTAAAGRARRGGGRAQRPQLGQHPPSATYNTQTPSKYADPDDSGLSKLPESAWEH